MFTPAEPASLPVADLCRRCLEETSRYLHDQPHDDSYCLEVFRRAVSSGDNRCWEELHAIYHELLMVWRRAAPGALELEPQEFAALTWEKFWQYYQPHHLEQANGLPAVLAYLRRCAWAAAVDAGRKRARERLLARAPQPAVSRSPDPADAYLDKEARREVWRRVLGLLRDERERVVVHCMDELGLRPAEVQARHADLFATVHDVYRARRNLLDRLERSTAFDEWRAGRGDQSPCELTSR